MKRYLGVGPAPDAVYRVYAAGEWADVFAAVAAVGVDAVRSAVEERR